MKTLTTLSTILIILFSFSFAKGESGNNNLVELKNSASNYPDGIYLGKSQSKYTGEPFWGNIQISLENGAFTTVQFSIRDTLLHTKVDSMYGVINYSAYPVYMQQCVNDGHGIEIYPQRVLKTQDVDKVDAISGATWSYNIFKATANEALKNGKVTTSINEFNGIGEKPVQVIPNPFYSTTRLEFSLTKKCHVNLSLYDSLGKNIKNLVDQEKQAGNYGFDWNDCPEAGIYFYHLKIDDKEFTGKLVKLKK